MRFFLKHSLILLTVLLTVSLTFGQSLQTDSLVVKFDRFRRTDYIEKIYVHINQSALLVGETVWFSVYAVDGSFHKGTQLSKVAYVEILDKNNVAVAQAKIALNNGLGSGSFYLSPLINAGNYQIRAYTNWMRNQPPSFYFHKQLTIINPFTSLERKKGVSVDKKIIAAFFPEGGNIIAGVTNKVGFKLSSPDGKGVASNGFLLNDKNDTLAQFSPLKFGIGNFSFAAEAGTVYRAVIKTNEGYVTYPLPTVKPIGYALRVIDNKDHFEIVVENKTSTNWPSYLLIHARNKIVLCKAIESTGEPARIQLHKTSLPDGICTATLFDAMMYPAAERVLYKHPTEKLTINAKLNQQDYSPRRPITLDIETSSPANLSVSVYRLDSISIPSSSTILDYLMLSSELKGVVESPEYYLSNDPHKEAALDNLMLTHGWRRFNWTDVLDGKKSEKKFVPEFNSPIISGKVFNENNEPVANILTYIASPSKAPRVYTSRSDAAGNIQFEMQNFYGPRKVVLQTNTKLDSIYHIQIDNPYATDFIDSNSDDFQLNTSIKNSLEERTVAMQVNDIYHRASHEKFSHPAIDTTAFYGKPDEKYMLDDFTRFPVMEEVLREYVVGVVVRKRRDGFHFMLVDHPSKTVFSESPFMLIDGIPFFDEDEIMSFSPLKVKQLDVMTQRYYLGYNHYSGVLSFRTYNGDLGGFIPNKHALVVDLEGLQLQREFYTPTYDLQKNRETRLPDQRQQLYWNPKISTIDGKQQLKFSTSDLIGNYIIEIEGISTDGTPGKSRTIFAVKNYNN
ncbi:hypothetical protein [Pseudochryseolinea flava]|uniref:Macroglobulin domain-containing protein n=1 Tax=Pseudochryseolinea flava TaxID=2059302 RepID=A0A364XZB8_9BACT|nr:hypothetical protein [Pseudochryseolinea flava]RAV99871.1 hypothetical protein DQQ10_17680 [Pseudochryseolinea flava]